MTNIIDSPVDPNSIDPWYVRPLDSRAHSGGEIGVNGKEYKGGEFMPFYVPRPVMPQINHHDLNQLIHFVRTNRVWVRRIVLHPRALHNHQKVNWDPSRWDPIKARQEIWISSDYFILDGNHRWYGHLKMGGDINTVQIGLPFEPAAALLFKFPKTTAGQT